MTFLGISELKWTGMGEFNSDDHYIYYRGQEPVRKNGVALIVNKRVRNAVLGCNLKNDRMICSFPRQIVWINHRFIHLLIDECLDFLYTGTITDKAAISFHIQIFL